MTDIRDLSERINEINTRNGFSEYESTPDKYKALYIGNKLMLAVSELVEAQDELRNGMAVGTKYYTYPDGADGPAKPEGVGPEIADAIVRLLHLAAEVGLDIDEDLVEKVEYNATRGYKHGKQF